MTTEEIVGCDDNRLNRYYDNLMDGEQAGHFEAHLQECARCRQRLAAMQSVVQQLRLRVQEATDAQDYTALEKAVLTTAFQHRRSASGRRGHLPASLKFAIPATIVAGVLLYFGYFNNDLRPPTAPSAIINSFTGSMSSVMIFETPETRQTILWYNEDGDATSEQNAL